MPAVPFFRAGPGAVPCLRLSSRAASSSMAFRPAGVAAHPSPSTLAIILAAIDRPAGWFSGSDGNRNRSRGFILPVSQAVRPEFSAIFMIPHHRAVTPATVIQRLTASRADWMTASVTASRRPREHAVEDAGQKHSSPEIIHDPSFGNAGHIPGLFCIVWGKPGGYNRIPPYIIQIVRLYQNFRKLRFFLQLCRVVCGIINLSCDTENGRGGILHVCIRFHEWSDEGISDGRSLDQGL